MSRNSIAESITPSPAPHYLISIDTSDTSFYSNPQTTSNPTSNPTSTPKHDTSAKVRLYAWGYNYASITVSFEALFWYLLRYNNTYHHYHYHHYTIH
jgi:hypothetical protein